MKPWLAPPSHGFCVESIDLDALRANAADIEEHHRLFDPRPVWTSAGT